MLHGQRPASADSSRWRSPGVLIWIFDSGRCLATRRAAVRTFALSISHVAGAGKARLTLWFCIEDQLWRPLIPIAASPSRCEELPMADIGRGTKDRFNPPEANTQITTRLAKTPCQKQISSCERVRRFLPAIFR
jgi:hypothetical protein